MLNLMVMRHGKSDWNAGARDDHGRPLSGRGVLSAERMGEVVRELGSVPDLVISSTAVRARATAELARITGGWESRLLLDGDLYGASVEATFDVLAGHGGDCERILIVGHQPTWSMVVKHLTGATVAMRTAAIADIEISSADWENIGSAPATLITLLQSRPFLPRSPGPHD